MTEREILEKINELEDKIQKSSNSIEKLFLTDDVNKWYAQLGRIYYETLVKS